MAAVSFRKLSRRLVLAGIVLGSACSPAKGGNGASGLAGGGAGHLPDDGSHPGPALGGMAPGGGSSAVGGAVGEGVGGAGGGGGSAAAAAEPGVTAGAGGAVPERLGDRQEPLHIVYPPQALRENGGPVINVKLAPYGAKGDGVTDDTPAFKALLNFLRDEVARLRGTGIGGDHRLTVYLPKGTYLVSDTLIHDGALDKGFCYLRLVGEERSSTTIKLVDNAAGFVAGSKKPVLAFTKQGHEQGNIMWGNELRNLTIDTGRGNPGAVAVAFWGANGSSIDNVTLRSGDGQGYAGLHFPAWSVQGHYSDITVTGFDDGVRCDVVAETQPTLEHLSLSGQRLSGVRTGRCAANLRKVRSENTAPAVVVEGDGGHVVLLDSQLVGGSQENAAVVVGSVSAQQLFARSVEVQGYGAGVRRAGEVAVPGSITEYLSGTAFTFTPELPTKSLGLPVEDFRYVPWEVDPARWASPEDYAGSDIEKVRAALSSGKPAVVFTKSYLNFDANLRIEIPPSVRQMEFLNQEVSLRFVIAAGSSEPLWVEHTSRKPCFYAASARPLYFRFGSLNYEVTTSEPVVAHLTNAAVLAGGFRDTFCPANATIFGRSLNEEARDYTNFLVNGGTLWVFGFKTEAHQSAFEVKAGGQLEVLGGYQNFAATQDAGLPTLHNHGSRVSYIGTNHMSRCYSAGIWETRGDLTQKFPNEAFPRRPTGVACNYFVPLYVGDAR